MLSVRDAIWMTVVCVLAGLWWTDRTVLAESVRLLRQGLEIQQSEAAQSQREAGTYSRGVHYKPARTNRG